MKAVAIDGYGGADRLLVKEVLTPVPGVDQVLVRARATSVNPIDWKLRKGTLRFVWPLKFPFTPGFDVAGIVEAVGANVSTWQIGDEVFAGLPAAGGYAELVAVDASLLAPKPENLSFEEAAVTPAASMSALQALRNLGRIQANDRVLVNGASGGVGHFAVQIAKAMLCHVTAVTSTTNLDFVRSLGADSVIDYRQDDVLSDSVYDVIFDVVPNLSFARCRSRLSARGCYVTTLPGPGAMFWTAACKIGRVIGNQRRCQALMLKPSGDDLRLIGQWIDDGEIKPCVSHQFDLESIQEATQQIESGHTRGKIAIRIGS